MNKIELLAPVGDFDCLKAAVQNGADSVYFGAECFSARASATNFSIDQLKDVIEYAKIRNVKTNLTLNTLIKDTEFESAFNLVKSAYEFGIDAIIVQDLGLATTLIASFPDLPIHASTQMTINNLEGVLEAQKLGFKRVVLARETSLEQIEYICSNSNIEIETFIHGALCVSYSGQCLLSSMIGGRSGNRGKCAQPCRLPYELFENDTKIDNGFLLSTRDLCGLEYIPSLINCGVACLKIEGRMKNPEYVATVTRIYRKYIDLALSNKNYIIDENDKKDLLQAFNRGMFSSGHLNSEPNKKLVYSKKPNNIGLPLGQVIKYNKNKGHITLKLSESLCVGDTVSLENETGTYTVSELMDKSGKNISFGNIGDIVTIGRMKGNISTGNQINKISSKNLDSIALNTIKSENKKILLSAKVTVKKGLPISISVKPLEYSEVYDSMNLNCSLDIIPVEAKNQPLTEEQIVKQITKTQNTPFEFADISIDLDDNVFIPKISSLNELRRNILSEVEQFAKKKIHRNSNSILKVHDNKSNLPNDYKISVLLNSLNLDFDYLSLKNIDNIYIPFKYFFNSDYSKILDGICKNFNTYIYMPTILKPNYISMFYSKIEDIVNSFKVRGFVLSNISCFKLFEKLPTTFSNQFEFITNYTLNVFNNESVDKLKKLDVSKYTVSPELDKPTILNLSNSIKKEMIVYGKIPLMNINYCLLGKSNKCFSSCSAKCKNTQKRYYLKDRLQMKFDVVPDNHQTVTTIYNSKTLSICPDEFNLDFARIDILFETIEEINNIINIVKSKKRFEGKDFTNGNLNRNV